MASSKDTRWGHVALIMSTALCIGMAIGLFPALLALNLDARGYDSTSNGLLAAMHGLAGLAVSPFVPRLMAGLGALKTYFMALACAAAAALLFTLSDDIGAWFALRFLMGVGLGIQWIVSETWVNQIAQGPRRGTIISVYLLVLTVGLATGPLILTVTGFSSAAPFFIAAAILALSGLPLLFLPAQPVAVGGHGKHLPLLDALRRKPSAMLAAVMDGFIFQSFMALLPLYFLRLGSPETAAIGMLNAFFLGSFTLQLVVGYALDRHSPAAVLFWSSLILLIGLAITAVPNLGLGWIWFAIFLMGGPAVAIFTAGLAGISDAFTAEEMPSGTAMFTMVWHVGGLAGPVMAGVAMDVWNPFGFAAVIAASLMILALANGLAMRPALLAR